MYSRITRLLIASVTGMWIALGISRGIGKAIRLANEVAIGDLSQAEIVTGNDEVKDMIDAGKQPVTALFFAPICDIVVQSMGAAYPELAIDMDVIVSGGLVHDVGKAWEFDPVNRKRWKAIQKQTGRPSIRHPAFGMHICLTVGLPEEVAHCAMAHSGEGELLVRSLECMIVHQADYTFWNTLLAGGQLKPRTVPPATRKYIIDTPF